MNLLLRTLASFVYDLIVLAALSVALAAIYTLLFYIGFQQQTYIRWLFQLNWLTMVAAYYLVSWRYAGQTIGMKAWRIQLATQAQQHLTWKHAYHRLIAASVNLIILNLGWLGYLMPIKCSLTDYLSQTHVMQVK